MIVAKSTSSSSSTSLGRGAETKEFKSDSAEAYIPESDFADTNTSELVFEDRDSVMIGC